MDVRIVCATHRDLAADIRGLRFRAEIHSRINVLPLAVPPLRERRDDIPRLIEAFVATLTRRQGRTNLLGVDDDALQIRCDYDWPANGGISPRFFHL